MIILFILFVVWLILRYHYKAKIELWMSYISELTEELSEFDEQIVSFTSSIKEQAEVIKAETEISMYKNQGNLLN